MKENKFQMIQKEKPPEYEKSENNNFYNNLKITINE